MTELDPPTKYEQAQEAARDGVTRTELTNMLLDLPHVHEALVQGENDDYRPTVVTVGFKESPGDITAHVDEIMRLAGWHSDGTSFALNRRHYVPRVEKSQIELRDMDYAIQRGQCYDVAADDFDGESYLREIDAIPDDYWQRWRDDNAE